MFSTFGGSKKREPLFTFKRKTLFSTNEDSFRKPSQQQVYNDFNILKLNDPQTRTENIMPNKPKTTLNSFNNFAMPSSNSMLISSSPSVLMKTISTTKPFIQPKESTVVEKEVKNDIQAEDDSIFDFPDSAESFSEIKVMVASTRAIPEMPKLKRKRPKPSKTKSKPLSLPNQSITKESINSQDKQSYTPLINSTSKTKIPTPAQKPFAASNKIESNKGSLDSMSNLVISESKSLVTSEVQSQPSFDIFEFDPDPTSHISVKTKNKPILNQTTTQPTTYFNDTLSVSNYDDIFSGDLLDFDNNYFNIDNNLNDTSFKFNHNNTNYSNYNHLPKVNKGNVNNINNSSNNNNNSNNIITSNNNNHNISSYNDIYTTNRLDPNTISAYAQMATSNPYISNTNSFQNLGVNNTPIYNGNNVDNTNSNNANNKNYSNLNSGLSLSNMISNDIKIDDIANFFNVSTDNYNFQNIYSSLSQPSSVHISSQPLNLEFQQSIATPNLPHNTMNAAYNTNKPPYNTINPSCNSFSSVPTVYNSIQSQSQAQSELQQTSIYNTINNYPTVPISSNTATKPMHISHNNQPVVKIPSITPTHQSNYIYNNPPIVKSNSPAEKKRKRNLVARLKTASGEKETNPKSPKFDFFSDEEDLMLEQQENEILPIREIITTKERSPSPELTYAEQMEKQLEAVMKSEFGKEGQEDEKPNEDKKDNSRRPRYQPLNKVNVRVTFEKSKKIK